MKVRQNSQVISKQTNKLGSSVKNEENRDNAIKMIPLLQKIDDSFLKNQPNGDQKKIGQNKNGEGKKRLRKMSLEKKSTEEISIGYFQNDEQFIEVYNSDPIFRHKVNFMIKESEAKLKRNPELALLKNQNDAEDRQNKKSTLRKRRSSSDINIILNSQHFQNLLIRTILCNNVSYGVKK